MLDRYDVVLITDARLPGGTAASVAEEVRAQARAGLRTGIVHLESHMIGEPRGFNPRVAAVLEEGLADLVVGGGVVRTRLAVLRHPGVIAGPPVTLPAIEAERALVVVNQTPTGVGGQPVFYDLDRARQVVTEQLHPDALWAPIGPLVRDNLTEVAPELPLLAEDWVNVIDVDRWAVDPARRWHRDVPVLGRHSRSHEHKWPATAQDILAAYPEGPDYEVRILGGAEHAIRRVTRTPANWNVLPFGSVDPRRFLAELDAFVYFHHPDWIESFGRTVLEALASGVPAILPPHFEALFGDAPVYTDPAGVLGVLDGWRADPAAARARAAAGQQLARERFSYDTHAARVTDLLAAEGTTEQLATRPRVAPRSGRGSLEVDARDATATTADAPPTVLFLSSNGSGVGHLMRLMSMASRASDRIRPIFLTLSQAVPVVRGNGFLVEYLMSREFMGIEHRVWHDLLRQRLAHLIDEHDVRAIVFDGTWPYRGLLGVLEDHPDVLSVWSRRGMWRPGLDAPSLQHSGRFDLIVEPGEFSERYDDGATAARRDEVLRVGPLTYLDPDDRVSREEAAEALGIDPSRPAVLLQLGAGNINDLGSLLGMVTKRLLEEDDLQVCVTRSIIAGEAAGLAGEVHTIRGVYPLSRYFEAFDMAIAAAGYNTFHELLAAGLPTLFFPNHETAADDQAARSRYAAEVGVALDVPDPTPEAVDAALTELLDPEVRARMRAAALERYPGNGAATAMAAIEHRIGLREQPPVAGPTGDTGPAPAAARPDTASNEARGTRRALEPDVRGRPPTAARARRARIAYRLQSPEVRRIARIPFRILPLPLRRVVRRQLRRWERKGTEIRVNPRVPVPPGAVIPKAERTGLDHVAIILPPGTDQRVAVDRIAALQAADRTFAPLIVTFDDDLARIRELRYAVELLVPEAVWNAGPQRRPWDSYVRDRLQMIATTYELDRMVTIAEVGGLDPLEVLGMVTRRPSQR
ncbi:glycosyltransferase [Nitriliruptor alkaliphilus]|uniref:glycosyltransferase n=1 Tax=Nitriliruptor alkaliphilus TaxID=427918 RepID=UPI000695C269|nr:glycosyltransferase [Nitriliruptor alkaliphilus]